MLMPGCLQKIQKSVQPIEEPIGQTGLSSSYYVGRLTVLLPPEVRVESVVPAARGALERRGYTIRRTETTADMGRVIARPPRGDRKVTVSARNLADSTSLKVRFEPWGDHAASVSLLEDVLTRLGY